MTLAGRIPPIMAFDNSENLSTDNIHPTIRQGSQVIKGSLGICSKKLFINRRFSRLSI
jgi:hypothetical protein